MVFDFRHKNIEGKWKSSGHRKGVDRDAAFASLEEKYGPMPSGRYMSRPRDGRTKNWDLFTHHPEHHPEPAEPVSAQH